MANEVVLQSLVHFCRTLRDLNIGGSIGEEIDAMKALCEVPWTVENIRVVLACTLIKEKDKIPLFYRYFDLYFGSNLCGVNSKELDSKIPCCQSEDDEGDGLGKKSINFSADAFIQYCLLGDKNQMKSTLKEFFQTKGKEILKEPTKIEEALRKIKVVLDWKRIQYRIEEESLLDGLSLEEITDSFDEEWQEILIEIRGSAGIRWLLERVNIQELHFFELGENQVKEMKSMIQYLAKRIRRKRGRVKKISRKGKLSLRQTLKTAFRKNPTLLYPKFIKANKPKMKLVILCDISGSMALFSEFFLQLAYTLHKTFKTIDSYIFVDSIEPASQYFIGTRVEENIKRLYNEHKASLTGFSNYGQAVQVFNENYINRVSKDSIVIVLGDGRSNYQPLQENLWWGLAKRGKKAYWLNPSPKTTWNKEDSMISLLTRYGYSLRECTNMRQLEKVVLEIFTR